MRHAALLCLSLTLSGGAYAAASSDSALNDEPVPLKLDEVPDRLPPLIEWGDTFLGAGNIDSGFRLPTGAVWQPNFMLWGNVRSGINHVDDELFTGSDELTEWVNRFDFFGQVSLSQTDRIVIGFRSFDEEGHFPGYQWQPDSDGRDEFSPEVSVAFLEVNLAEVFPGYGDGDASRELDMDLSIGRQPLFFQEGLLINDRVDAIAVSRNNLSFLPGASNTRASVVYAWDSINRANTFEVSDAKIWGLFTETDFPKSTVNLDIMMVESDDTGDAFYAGLSAIQRIGKLNTAFRILHSDPDRETPVATRGTLAMAEISWTPPYTYDNVYTNFFWSERRFSSAARDIGTGGPMGIVGILFAGAGLGSFPGPLGNSASEAYGMAVGYQKFFSNNRRQVIFEFGGRNNTDRTEFRQMALGVRFQQALGRHFVLRFDGYAARTRNFIDGFGNRENVTGFGARAEVLVKF